MNSNSFETYTGVGVAGMSWTLRTGLTAASAAHARVAAHGAIPQPKRRNDAATVASVSEAPPR